MSDSEQNVSGSYRPPVDLDNCDREPIHVPGAIQPHGVALTLDEPDLRMLQVSVNSRDVLGIDCEELLGNQLQFLLGSAQTNSFRKNLASSDLSACNPMKLSIGEGEHQVLLNGIIHRYKGVLFLELEPVGVPVDAPLRSYQMIQIALKKIERTTTPAELWRVVVEEVQSILEYDRVMVYKFDRSGNGAVIEEKVVNGKEPYFGLHYPASDIPQQARVLYSLNYTRHIADVNYKPAELIPLIYPPTRDLTDLTYSTLRSVSPLHIEYLRNMGVAASLSISIMEGTSLWGLIACHHYSPKFVPFELRTACELLGQVVSSRMVALENIEQTHYKSASTVLQAKFLEALSFSNDLKAALIESTPNLMDYVPAGGCALCVGKDHFCLGNTPSPDQLTALLRKLRRFSSPVFVTDDLHSAFPEAAEYKEVGSGLLCMTISKEKQIHLLWFRPEQVQTVNWAGDPLKSVDQEGDFRLHPRKSFALWKETVSNKSVSWSEAEIQSITELRSTIMGLIISRTKPSN